MSEQQREGRAASNEREREPRQVAPASDRHAEEEGADADGERARRHVHEEAVLPLVQRAVHQEKALVGAEKDLSGRLPRQIAAGSSRSRLSGAFTARGGGGRCGAALAVREGKGEDLELGAQIERHIVHEVLVVPSGRLRGI
jgi:hypothetical protein